MRTRHGLAIALASSTLAFASLSTTTPTLDALAPAKTGEHASTAKSSAHSRTKQARGSARAAPPRLPRPVSGQLRRGDARLQSGEFVDRLQARFPVGQPVQIRLSSTAFDAYLIVRSPTGVEMQNDDMSQTVRNSGVDIAAAEDGAYTILVTSYQAGETGRYQLRYVTGQPPAPAPTTPNTPPNTATTTSTTTASTSPGASQPGELATGDRQLRSGEFYDTFTRTLTAGQSLRVRLESTAFDPYLIVRAPSGAQSDNDDTTPQDRNSTVEIASTEAGTYTIMVTSYAAGEHGAYQLITNGGSAQATPPNTTTPNTTTPPPSNGASIAAAANGGRVFGIFGGISDYPGTQNDLDDCADDATKLALALRRANLMTDAQQIVLTDSQMTTTNVRQAMQRMASQVGPNDIFFFFYSGHGGQNPGSRDAREIDGIDETVFLYDDEIVDDEMGQLFDAIHGRLSVLTLDSCFSGGFAKDVITTGGRVGFFSSEEDVTSGVASEFHAGGYLSYFLREGVGGDADTSPHDQTLTVGELEHYLIGQFGQHAMNVAMDGAFQHLVSDRGAVSSTTQLWNFR